MLCSSSFDGVITLLTNSYKDNIRKENYRPVYFMNIDAESLQQIPANWV